MKNLNTKNKVELAIVCLLAVISMFIRRFDFVSEQFVQTFALGTVVFIFIIAFLYLYRWLKDVAAILKE